MCQKTKEAGKQKAKRNTDGGKRYIAVSDGKEMEETPRRQKESLQRLFK